MSHQHNIGPGPIAPENNPPINPQYFQPRTFEISAIARGNNTVVTTTIAHDFVIGQLCRLLIPVQYGARQLNQQTGYVIDIPAANQVILTISSVNATAFSSTPSSSPNGLNIPVIIPIGDVNTGYINPTGRASTTTTVPGSFINISPL